MNHKSVVIKTQLDATVRRMIYFTAKSLYTFRVSTAPIIRSRAETECDGTRIRTGGEVKGEKANGGGSQQSCTVSDTVYPALLPLMRTPRLPAAD